MNLCCNEYGTSSRRLSAKEDDRPLRVLLIEDSESDAYLLEEELRSNGYAPECRRVDSLPGLRAALEEPAWDVIIADFALPGFDALEALRLVQQSAEGDVPYIIVSGSIDDRRAVESLRAGAHDFLVKDNLARLAPAIEREMREARVRRERREALDALQRSVQARDDFLAITSHELRTPATSLKLRVQSLERYLSTVEATPVPLAPELKSKIGGIARNTEQLVELINRMLDVCHVTRGPLELDLADVDLADVVRDATARLAGPLRNSGSRLELEVDAPVRGYWDRMRLGTMVALLLSNAAKYGRGNPIRVAVEEQKTGAHLTVQDHGIGISLEDQQRLFQRFEQAVPTRNYGGFGTSLWVAQQIARAHGGRINLTSQPSVGSTFQVSLPKVPPGS